MTGIEIATIAGMSITAADAMVAAGAVTGVLGAISSARQGAASSNFNAAVQDRNAQIAQQEASATIAQQEIDYRRKMGQARANFGASGEDPNSDSALDVMADQSMTKELDEMLTQYKADRGTDYFRTQAELSRESADRYETQGIVGAGSTLLTAGSTFGNKTPKPNKLVPENNGGNA